MERTHRSRPLPNAVPLTTLYTRKLSPLTEILDTAVMVRACKIVTSKLVDLYSVHLGSKAMVPVKIVFFVYWMAKRDDYRYLEVALIYFMCYINYVGSLHNTHHKEKKMLSNRFTETIALSRSSSKGSVLVGAVVPKVFLLGFLMLAALIFSGFIYEEPDGLLAQQEEAFIESGGFIIERGPSTDREILMALYQATDGPNWQNSNGWGTDAPLDEWYGVSTDSKGRVTSLSLTGNGLRGRIPYALGTLQGISGLFLSDNNLEGSIPYSLGDSGNLQEIWLSNNNLTENIPDQLINPPNIHTIQVSNNNLTGNISDTILNKVCYGGDGFHLYASGNELTVHNNPLETDEAGAVSCPENDLHPGTNPGQ